MIKAIRQQGTVKTIIIRPTVEWKDIRNKPDFALIEKVTTEEAFTAAMSGPDDKIVHWVGNSKWFYSPDGSEKIATYTPETPEEENGES